MTSLIVGLILLVSIGWSAIHRLSLSTPPVEAMLIVGGGAVTVFFLTLPLKAIFSVARHVAALLKPEDKLSNYHSILKELARSRMAKASKDPLIRYAQNLWQEGVGSEQFAHLLVTRKKELDSEWVTSIAALKNLAKYPPALGMIGTVLGMVGMFTRLDANAKDVGASLGLAMMSTLFGLVLTNFIIAPLADRLQVKRLQHQKIYQVDFQSLVLINEGEPESLLEDEMNQRAAG